ncbi:DUF6296 family protein [Kitasatospora sp. NPDC006697]|uniref:DUF6296 family protein n=1 Tax=Kitasatospora sp. NPDC006697 TaxID=3364020 RepID=UPI00368F2668
MEPSLAPGGAGRSQGCTGPPAMSAGRGRVGRGRIAGMESARRFAPHLPPAPGCTWPARTVVVHRTGALVDGVPVYEDADGTVRAAVTGEGVAGGTAVLVGAGVSGTGVAAEAVARVGATGARVVGPPGWSERLPTSDTKPTARRPAGRSLSALRDGPAHRVRHLGRTHTKRKGPTATNGGSRAHCCRSSSGSTCHHPLNMITELGQSCRRLIKLQAQ